MKHDLASKFAPTPMHGAAYAVAIKAVGGMHEIGACGTVERYNELQQKLAGLLAFARTLNRPDVVDAYEYGVAKVNKDLRSRLEIIQNSAKVTAALEKLPKPENL